MKKEVFLAVFVGFALGLIITFGIWTANKSLRPVPVTSSPTPSAEAGVEPTPPAAQVTLSVSDPVDESVTSTSTVTVTGKTLPSAPVIITGEGVQSIVVADNAGDFEQDVKLEAGYNRLTVSVYDGQGNSVSKQLLVTYTTSKI